VTSLLGRTTNHPDEAEATRTKKRWGRGKGEGERGGQAGERNLTYQLAPRSETALPPAGL